MTDSMAALDQRALNRAASQLDRRIGAPAPHRVEVDGHDLAELLSFAADYGGLIQFYDLSNMPDGDWSIFFLSDESIVLALRARLDIGQIEAEFDDLLDRLRASRSIEERLEIVAIASLVLLRLIRILVPSPFDPPSLEQAVAALAASPRRDLLGPPALRLAAHLGGAAPEDRIRQDVAGLVNGWFDQFVDFLGELVESLISTLEQGRAEAIAQLEKSLTNQTHPPQSGLYDAFSILFGHARKAINRFPERLVHFYMADILRQASRVGEPDSLCLTFTPAKGLAQADLPKGTAFSAGVDSDGKTIGYALDSALTVDEAAVSALRMITATAQSPAPDAPLALAQMFSSEVALSPTPPTITSPVLLFGETQAGTDAPVTTTTAILGFAIVSPTLWLAGGQRIVTLDLTLSADSLTALTPMLDSIGAAAGGMSAPAVLAALFEAGLALRYSTAGGWIDVVAFTVTPPSDGGATYVLSFTLDPDADGLLPSSTKPAAADASTDGPTIDADQPTIMATLIQRSTTLGTAPTSVDVYPYAALALVMLDQLALTVDVSGLSDVQASTPGGLVDTGQPFATFGSPPVQNARLDISAPELFVKTITSLSLTLDWFGLPATSDGFRGYYQGYVIDADGKSRPAGTLFNNHIFRGRLELVNPGSWTITPADQRLFASAIGALEPDIGKLLPEVILLADVRSNAPPTYYDPTQSAVRLQLTEPSYAFGNVLYPANVMAASVQLTATASACAQRCGQAATMAVALLDPLIVANATASDAKLADAVEAAAELTIANLDGAAIQAIQDAIAACDVDAATKAAWRDSLAKAAGEQDSPGWLRRHLPWGGMPDGATVHDNLKAWLTDWRTANAGSFNAPAAGYAANATALAAAGDGVDAVVAAAKGKPATVARPMTAARLGDVQATLSAAIDQDNESCVQKCLAANPVTLPNQPWLPQTSALALSYDAGTVLPLAAGAPAATYYYLRPFGVIDAVDWQAGKPLPLLPPVEAAGSLYIGMSAPADTLSLLFRLGAPDGGWPTDTPEVDWSVASTEASGWEPLTPLSDTTNNLRNTGIVSLSLEGKTPATPLWLRVSAPNDLSAFPELVALVPNAATAHWTGPGGAAALGTPLPAGTITKPLMPIPALGSIDQPMPSAGGRPRLAGRPFDLWMAERLRHKDRGIQAWDYGRLLLAAFPSLWQVAVVPVSDGGGKPVPGHLWIVPVPGPETPAVADPRIPSNDATILQDIYDYLTTRISHFIQLTITNPPYLGLTVDADIIFTNDDTVDACIARLNQELIVFLSPWPTPALEPRPEDYYTRRQVAHFIRHRPYVLGIRTLDLIPDAATLLDHGRYYLTSAPKHALRGSGQTPPSLLPAPRLALAPASTGGQ